MKKTLFIIICVITAIVICSCGNVKYSSGRDTIASFGDGTYQIGQTHTHKRIFKNLEYKLFMLITKMIPIYMLQVLIQLWTKRIGFLPVSI